MAARAAWVLNLDADVELAAHPGARYTPTRAVLEATRKHASRLAGSLVPYEDLVVDDDTPPGAAANLVGRAFCPTPRAIALLVRAGATPEAHPSRDVLRAVNSRAFAASLGPTLLGAAFVHDLPTALAHLRAAPPGGDAWRMKRAFGMAGRGQRLAGSTPSAADVAFLEAGFEEGGVQIEPNLVLDAEYAIHGHLEANGERRLGALVRQECDARGAWQSTHVVEDPSPLGEIASGIAAEARTVADALANAGYFGPFGVDAFTYRDAGGRLCLQPRSEINARYSMGFAVGFRVPSGER